MFTVVYTCSQVHEIHPSHAFLVVPEKPVRMRSEPALDISPIVPDVTGEACKLLHFVSSRFIAHHIPICTAMTHKGVKCAQ